MPAATTSVDATQNPAQSRIDQAIDIAIMIGLAVLILIGFATSYRTLRDLATTEGGYPPWLAPAVPLSFDLGIIVLSLKVARAAREARTAPVMRLLVAALSAATVVANASAASTPTARLLHAVPPAMFVICFESVIITARRQALSAMRLLPEPLPRLRAARWFLAPSATWRRWRQQVLADAAHDRPLAPQTSHRVEPPTRQTLEGVDDQISARAVPAVRMASTRQAHGSDQIVTRSARDTHAAQLLRQHPAATAPELVRLLERAGHRVSVRTAQRLRRRLPDGSPDVGTGRDVHLSMVEERN